MKVLLLSLGLISSVYSYANDLSNIELELYSDLVINQETEELPVTTYYHSENITSECFLHVKKTLNNKQNHEELSIPQGTRIKLSSDTPEVSSAALNYVHYAKVPLLLPAAIPFTKIITKKFSHEYLESISCAYTRSHGFDKLTPISDEEVLEWIADDLNDAFRVIPEATLKD